MATATGLRNIYNIILRIIRRTSMSQPDAHKNDFMRIDLKFAATLSTKSSKAPIAVKMFLRRLI